MSGSSSASVAVTGKPDDNLLLRPPRLSGSSQQDWQSVEQYLNDLYQEAMRRRRALARATAQAAAGGDDGGQSATGPWNTLLGMDITNPADWFETRYPIAPTGSGVPSPPFPMFFWDNQGNLTSVEQPADVKDMGLWLDHTPRSGYPVGVWVHPPMRNLANPVRSFVARVGDLSTTGVLPAGWSFENATDLTITVVSVSAEENEMEAIDIRLTGTLGADAVVRLFLRDTFGAVDNAALPASASVYARLLAGSLTGLGNDGIRLELRQDGSAGLPPVYSDRAPLQDLPLVTQRIGVSFHDDTAIGLAYRRPALAFSFQAAQLIDMTLRIGAPQLENLPYVSMFGPQGRTRLRRFIRIPTLGVRFNPRRGTLILGVSTYGAFTKSGDDESYWFGLFTFLSPDDLGGEDAGNQMGVVINPEHTSVETRIITNNDVQPASIVSIDLDIGDPASVGGGNETVFRSASERAAGRRGGAGFFREALTRDEQGRVRGSGRGDGNEGEETGGGSESRWPGDRAPFLVALAWEDDEAAGTCSIQLAAYGYVGNRVTIIRPERAQDLVLGQLVQFAPEEADAGTSFLAGHFHRADLRVEAFFDEELAALTIPPSA